MGNVIRVDAINGNDSTGVVGGAPYLTIQAAVAAATSGTTVWVLPGTYNLTAGINIPNGIALRGLSTQTCIIQLLGVTSNTTLINMGENCRIEDLTLNLTSAGHYTLKGMEFNGTSTQTSKLRTCVLTVDNSSASSGGTSNIYGVECNGTGVLTSSSFSFNCLKGSTINVKSNGSGNKRGIIVTGSNIASTRDLNVYVAAPPTNLAFTGSYVGVETNDIGNVGSIQMRSTTVGIVKPTGAQTYTASDILQTTPPTILDPSYLASAGIQLGPGTDLVAKSAGGNGFSTFVYPTTIYYGLKGNITSAPSGGWLWAGTQGVSAGTFPDTGFPPAYYRLQQPAILSGMSASLVLPCGGTTSLTLTIYKTLSNDAPGDTTSGTLGTKTVATIFAVTFASSDIQKAFYNGSVDFAAGDRIHVYVTYTNGSPANGAHDLTLQLDLF